MIQHHIRVVKWLNTTPALGVCSVCSREFNVPMNALKRSADAQATLQDQFDRHKCQSLDSSEVDARANVLLRQEPDEEDDEKEDDRREEDDDDDEAMAMGTPNDHRRGEVFSSRPELSSAEAYEARSCLIKCSRVRCFSFICSVETTLRPRSAR